MFRIASEGLLAFVYFLVFVYTNSVIEYADDGYFDKRKNRVILSTDSYSLEEVNLLYKALTEKFNLDCYINKHGDNGYIIAIATRSMATLQALLNNRMPIMMRHKIGLD